ncbi:MAG: cytochrome P450 [Chloroflexota bacterium]|nr:cytochrome P450 [Chloroflexota bacterium]
MALARAAVNTPGPTGIPLLGSLPTIRKKGPLDFYIDLWREFGDVAVARLGPLTSFVFTRPEHLQYIMVQNPDKYIKGISHEKLRVAIGNGILTLEGERWYRQHKLMQPNYTRKNVNVFAEIMREESQAMLARWDALPAGSVVDINQETTRLTMAVITRSIFGFNVGEDFQEAVQALHNLLEYTSQTTNSLIDMPLFVPTPTNQMLKRARKTLRAFIMDIIEQRRREGLQEDLLSMLMSARNAETGEVMTDDELHDEILITIFAGHETTASLLMWAWYLLSGNSDAEQKLHAEVDTVLNGRQTTLDDLPKLTYTRMVLDETLRLYSPVPMMARDATSDDTIAGHTVPKGAMLVLLPFATHRHPEFWEKPLDFYPEHFAPAATETRPRYAYLPFGAGQRICLGMHFALLEATLVLADVAQRYRPRLAVDFDGSFRFIGVMRPSAPIMMRLERR